MVILSGRQGSMLFSVICNGNIELSSDTDFRGYWESVGYNNNAEVGGPAFE